MRHLLLALAFAGTFVSPVVAQQAAADKPSEIVFPVKIVAEPAKSAEDITAEKASQQREIEDLEAQKSMSATNISMMLISMWQLLLGIIGAIAVAVSIFISARATKAATDAVKTTVDVARDQSRAYVHTDRATYTSGQKANGPGPAITLYVENTGQTPAKWFELLYSVALRPSAAADVKAEEIRISIDDNVRNSLGGGAVVAIEMNMEGLFAAIADTYRNNINNKTLLVLLGTIKYKTFYDELFVTDFAFELDGMPQYQEEVVFKSPQGDLYGEVAREMTHATGRFRAFERFDPNAPEEVAA